MYIPSDQLVHAGYFVTKKFKNIVFIPAYNCETQILRVLDKLRVHQDFFDQVLVIDNCSTDKTVSVARDFIRNKSLSNFNVLINTENLSLGGSHKVAFRYALEQDFSHITVLHGDDQGDFTDLCPHLRSGDAFKFDCILGSRFNRNSRLIGYSKFRIFGNKVLNAFCSFCTGSKIEDMGAGLNLYNVEVLRKSNFINFPDDLTFNVFLLFEHGLNKENYTFIPISWRELDQTSNAKLFRQAFRILCLGIKTFINPNHLKTIQNLSARSYDYDSSKLS